MVAAQVIWGRFAGLKGDFKTDQASRPMTKNNKSPPPIHW
jgi:hypothetical protein